MSEPRLNSALGRSVAHESGMRHATGEARYVDDLAAPPNTAVCVPVVSPHARAHITDIDTAAASAVDGVLAVLTWEDVPGDNRIGPLVHDEALLAQGDVYCVGQPVALVVARDYDVARRAAKQVSVSYNPLPAVLTIEQAVSARSFHQQPRHMRTGDPDGALNSAAIRIEGSVRSGGQEHFYLETQATLAIPGEGRTMTLYSSTQHPSELQKVAASVLGVGVSQVICEVPRMGGGFGGKESQATGPGCLAAVAAAHLGRPVKVWLSRDDDVQMTGGRHPFLTHYRAGFDVDGKIVALVADLYCDGGWSLDLSFPILDRALMHADNAYFLPNAAFTGHVCLTNLPSNTAFRGFGGPQGMLVVEDAINRYAERTGRDPWMVREANYYGPAPRDRTPYGQQITHNRLPCINEALRVSSDYLARRREIAESNRSSAFVKRGIGFQPIKFGISFTKSFLNQAGALILVYADGSVQLNHGGTEMGQGLYTKMIAVCAEELGVDRDAIRHMATATDKVPNTSATAASSGADINGQAVREASVTLRERMTPIARECLGAGDSTTPVTFRGGRVFLADSPESSVAFADVAANCWMNCVSLAATGFYQTPGISYQEDLGKGHPFYYYAFGGAVTEVEVSGLTGEYRVRRVDILHDVGDSLVPSIDIGQVEGAFVQGMGWLTCEEILFDERGHLRTTGPSTYKVPAFGDAPIDFRVALLDEAPQPGVIGGSKAVGEPPFMLAISVWTALRHAVSAFGESGREVQLQPPCTAEAVLRAISMQKDEILQADAVGAD